MADEYELIGVVEKSLTRPRGGVGLITILDVSPRKRAQEFVDSEMNIPGSHPLNRGDRIRLKYEIHTGVCWVNSYEVLDKKGKVLRSSIIE